VRAKSLVLASLLLASTVLAAPAQATNYCGDDKGIWLIQKFDNGYGSWSEIQKVNDSLVACNDGLAVVVHTAGVTFSLVSGTSFLEVGLHRSVNSGIQRNRVFGEYGFYPDVYGPFYYGTYSTGGTVDMKVTNVPGTWNWKLYWDVPAGGALDWVLLDTFNGMTGQHGWAWGEHARIGKTGTGGYDHHYDMQFKNGAGNWEGFHQLLCWIDSDADWKWTDISDTEFVVEEGTRACEPHI